MKSRDFFNPVEISCGPLAFESSKARAALVEAKQGEQSPALRIVLKVLISMEIQNSEDQDFNLSSAQGEPFM